MLDNQACQWATGSKSAHDIVQSYPIRKVIASTLQLASNKKWKVNVGCLAQVYNTLFRLLDHEIGAAVQPAELGPFFVTIFSVLGQKQSSGTLCQLFMGWTSCLMNLGGSPLDNFKYPEEMRTSTCYPNYVTLSSWKNTITWRHSWQTLPNISSFSHYLPSNHHLLKNSISEDICFKKAW